MDELENLPERPPNERGRLAVLIVCNAGKLTGARRGLLRARAASLSEVLLRKRFVDAVVAPDHVLGATEAAQAIDALRNSPNLDVAIRHIQRALREHGLWLRLGVRGLKIRGGPYA